MPDAHLSLKGPTAFVHEDGEGGPTYYSAAESLALDGNRRESYFLADILDAAPKNDIASMEHPLFALRAGDRRARVYERNGSTVTVKPGVDGCATIHDKDLWIYCISQMVEAKNRGRAISRTVRFIAYDFLTATNRDTSGRAYQRLGEMLARLTGTRIETNIETAGKRERGFFGLVDSAKVIDRDGNGRMVAVELTLPDWLFRSVDTMRVLTLSRDYFLLRKPLDRRIYELARKHCGVQPNWRVSLAVLHRKSGSVDELRNFRVAVRLLAESSKLPDFLMSFDDGRDIVMFYSKGSKGSKGHIARAENALAMGPVSSWQTLKSVTSRRKKTRS